MKRPVILSDYPLVTGRLSPLNRIKLLALALLAGDLLSGEEVRPITLRFDSLAESMADRYEFVNSALAGIDLAGLMEDGSGVERFFSAESGLALHPDQGKNSLMVSYLDEFRPEEFAREAARIKSPDRLAQTFHNRLKELRQSPHNVQAYELALERIYEDRRRRIVESLARRMATRLSSVPDLGGLYKAYQDFQEDPAAFEFDRNQKLALRQAFEVRLEQLRSREARDWSARLERVRGPAELQNLWEDSKPQLMARRRFIGRQLERRIARWFDLKAAELADRKE